jgi:type II secretory pathway component GspD/PulD (secretin)
MFTRLMRSGVARLTAVVVVLAVVVLTTRAQDRPGPGPRPAPGGKSADLDKARADVCRALEQFREAEAKLRDAEKRLREMEGKGEPEARDLTGQMRVFRLKNAEAATVATVIQDVFGKGRLVIAVDPVTNSIIVRATIDDQLAIGSLLEQLDVPADRPDARDRAPEMKIYRLKNAEAQAVAKVVHELFGGQGRMVVVADTNTNTIIVRAALMDHVSVEKLLQILDERPTKPEKRDKDK